MQTLPRKPARRKLKNRRAQSGLAESDKGRGGNHLRLLRRAIRRPIASHGFGREGLLQVSQDRRKTHGRALEPTKAADQMRANRVIAAILLSERSRDTSNHVPRITRHVRNGNSKENSVRNTRSKSNARSREIHVSRITFGGTDWADEKATQ